MYIHMKKEMRYKSWWYNVEPIAKRLPDDCLKIVISYAYDVSVYNAICTFLKKHKIYTLYHNNAYYNEVHLYNSQHYRMYSIQKNNLRDVIHHFRVNKATVTIEIQTKKIIFTYSPTIYATGSLLDIGKWYINFNNEFQSI